MGKTRDSKYLKRTLGENNKGKRVEREGHECGQNHGVTETYLIGT
jgi:hypothetical protein